MSDEELDEEIKGELKDESIEELNEEMEEESEEESEEEDDGINRVRVEDLKFEPEGVDNDFAYPCPTCGEKMTVGAEDLIISYNESTTIFCWKCDYWARIQLDETTILDYVDSKIEEYNAMLDKNNETKPSD